MNNPKMKVSIHCKHCGEKFILRARKNKGKLNTGFKRCVCDNDEDFELEVQQL